jgi:predicted acyl esterase
MESAKSEVRDGMQIDWDAPITMDDGLVLRADVFRPVGDGRYPVVLSYGPRMPKGWRSRKATRATGRG